MWIFNPEDYEKPRTSQRGLTQSDLFWWQCEIDRLKARLGGPAVRKATVIQAALNSPCSGVGCSAKLKQQKEREDRSWGYGKSNPFLYIKFYFLLVQWL